MNVTMNTTKTSLPMRLEPYQSGSFTYMMSGCKGGWYGHIAMCFLVYALLLFWL